MLCQKCQKRQANFHYTQVINNAKTEFNLCSQCAHEMGLTKNFNDRMSLSGMLDSFFAPHQRGVMMQMPRVFKVDGEKLYRNEFEHEIDKMFCEFGEETKRQNEMEKDNKNKKKNTVENLKLSLKKAIEEERFEDAARIRDEIKEIEGK